MSTQPPTVGELGEFGLIAALTARLTQGPGVLLGPGDDAAVVAAPDGRVAASSDLLAQDVHFSLAWSTGRDVGHKAAAANLADIAAMGAVPTALLMSLGLPADLPAAWALELAEGMQAEAALVGASVVGGDVIESASIVVAVTALGDLQGRAALTRGGARPGDVVGYCGRLGWSSAGLFLLGSGWTLEHPEIVDAHRRPAPPYSAGPQAASLGATALIDVSDGLMAELGHLARASGVAIDVDRDRLAPDPELRAAAATLHADPVALMLNGGEDHALLGTFPADTELPPEWQVIGRVAEGGPAVTLDGEQWHGGDGWEHF